jgi:hypothetical protein
MNYYLQNLKALRTRKLIPKDRNQLICAPLKNNLTTITLIPYFCWPFGITTV